jgi:hypothetical protein
LLLEKEKEKDDTINNIINYITTYKYIIIDTIILHYDNVTKWISCENALCYFLGTYDEHYCFLTFENLNDIISYIHNNYMYFEIIKEENNKYSGLVIFNNINLYFISNIDMDYNYIIENNCNGNESIFYNDCHNYLNENEIIQEYLEGFLHKFVFDEISIYSVYNKHEYKFKKIVYQEIIKSSITHKFSSKVISFVQNNKNILEKFKNKEIFNKIKKYKNLQSFIKKNL